ncbi:MAG: thioredoxin domain-containing protein, partial [Bdellovibrionales bacterium]|nr:thioredoxin domain-containing protein [Bdellovibrionales bacterium]
MNSGSTSSFDEHQSRVLNATFFIVAVGFLLCLFSSYEFIHFNLFPYSGGVGCGITEGLDCKDALQSHYSSFLGRSLGNWGALFYSGVLIFLLVWKRSERKEPDTALDTLFILCSVSVALSIFLFFISMTQLSALCPVCLTLYAVSIALLVAVYLLGRSPSISFVNRVGNGVIGSLGLVRGIPRFLISEVFRRLFTREFPFAVFLLVLGTIGFFSDQGFYLFFSKTEKRDVAVENIGKEWERQPVRDILSDTKAGPLQDYVKGPSDSPIRIVEFFDFECPYCRMFYFDLRDLREKYSESVRVEYRNYPLDHRCNPHMPANAGHANACEAALFSRCAGEQGKYFEALEYLMTLEILGGEANPRQVRNSIRRGSEVLGLDSDAIYECMKSERQLEVLSRDITIATELDLKGTPTVWV